MSISTIIKKRITTKNWNDIPLEQHKIDYILDCATNAPSKQSLYNYRIVVLGNSEKAIDVKTWLFQSDTWCDNKGNRLGKASTMRNYNGQYKAPLVLVWLQKEQDYNKSNTNKKLKRHQTQETDLVDITVSASFAMLAAEEQSLQTGFGRCHGVTELAKKLGYSGSRAELVLGIGYGTDHSLSDNHDKLIVYNKKGNMMGYNDKNIPADAPGVKRRANKPTMEELIHYY